MAQTAGCSQVLRGHAAEQLRLSCASAESRARCLVWRDAMHERARFALKLPPSGRPLLHQQALRLQCGGIAAVAQLLEAERPANIAGLLQQAEAAFHHPEDAPWDRWVILLRQWQPRQRRAGGQT